MMPTEAATQPVPAIARLVSSGAAAWLEALPVPHAASQGGEAVVFVPGDPVRHPEALDVATVLPELARALGGRFATWVARPALEAELAARHGVRVFPALLCFRGGGFTGAVTGMHDWMDFVVELRRALAAEPVRERVGLPVVVDGSAAACRPGAA